MLGKALTTAAAGSAGGDYEISRSLRFNSADSAYLARTPGTAGDRKTWTWSGWVKRSKQAEYNAIFYAYSSATSLFLMRFQNDDKIMLYQESGGVDQGGFTSALFRDPSAWYHIVLAVDTTQATDTDRMKLYVNGVQVAVDGTYGYFAPNADTLVNSTATHYLGTSSLGLYMNGYMADINFVDGAALTPSSFGEVNEITGVWTPIRFAGPYNVGTGVNGFHLEFADNSDVTATTLGKDTSGNGNNWTPSGSPGFSVTAGAGNDSLVDSPTRYGTDTGAGGEVRGNYATLNPLAVAGASAITISNGNLDLSIGTYGAWRTAVSTFSISSGKWYWEVKINTASDVGDVMIGIAAITAIPTTSYSGSNATSYGYNGGGSKFNNGIGTAYGASMSAGDTIGVSLDMSTGDLVFYRNGVSQGTAFTVSTTTVYVAAVSGASTTPTYSLNFGQRPFTYTAPSGFKALVTTNLPEPTVVQGDNYFNTVLYTGNAVQDRTITGVGFDPDLVWIKARSIVGSHVLMNRLSGGDKQLFSNLTNAEQTNTDITNGFASDGFILGDNVSGTGSTNQNSYTYAAWNWKANGAGSSNTDGTITSTVSANQTAGISIVTYTGTSVNATVGHGLGVQPSMVIVKNRDNGAAGWYVEHIKLTGFGTYSIFLNQTSAESANSTHWNNTAPTSSVFSVGTSGGTNESGSSHVAYCFAEVPGFSAFGSYTGNGSTDGTFVYTGFRPRWILYKPSNRAATDWVMWDTARSPYNIASQYLLANTSGAEGSIGTVDILSNGFKLRVTSTGNNGSGDIIVYAAFAENPFKNSLAR